jgi:hypothetical protein
MASVTLVQTTLYHMGLEWLGERIQPELLPLFHNIDLLVIALALSISFLQWKKGTEGGFARIFSLNMLLFFPAILDFSRFNWVGLVIGFVPDPGVGALWVFGVGLLLQINYLWIRHTLRFRSTRKDLLQRGATDEDINKISSGQMWYLTILMMGTALITGSIYVVTPLVRRYISEYIDYIPNPNMVIGLFTVIILSISIILYLRSGSRVENEDTALDYSSNLTEENLEKDIMDEERDENTEGGKPTLQN